MARFLINKTTLQIIIFADTNVDKTAKLIKLITYLQTLATYTNKHLRYLFIYKSQIIVVSGMLKSPKNISAIIIVASR